MSRISLNHIAKSCDVREESSVYVRNKVETFWENRKHAFNQCQWGEKSERFTDLFLSYIFFILKWKPASNNNTYILYIHRTPSYHHHLIISVCMPLFHFPSFLHYLSHASTFTLICLIWFFFAVWGKFQTRLEEKFVLCSAPTQKYNNIKYSNKGRHLQSLRRRPLFIFIFLRT